MNLHGYYFNEHNDRLHAPDGAVVATIHHYWGGQVEVSPNFEPKNAVSRFFDPDLPLETHVAPLVHEHRLLTTTAWERFNARLAAFAASGGWQWVGIVVSAGLGTAGLWVALSK